MNQSSRLPRSMPSLDAELAAARAEAAALRAELDRSRQAEAAALESERQARTHLEYRVRNMLAIVRSLFSRTVAAGGTLEEMADHFRGRFDVFARYQSSAGRPGDGRDLEAMVWDELRNFEFDDRISTEGPEVRVIDDTALMIGLALHELVTNSIKFGALSHTEGQSGVAVRWTLDDDMVTIRWEETGVPVVAVAPFRRGFGREFIEHALPYQLGTESSFELRPGGVLCTIVVPVGKQPRAGLQQV